MKEVKGQQAVRLRTEERRQEVSILRGVGLYRRTRKIRRTVAALMR